MDMNNLFETFEMTKILGYIQNNQEENLNIEFKTVGNANLANRDDKENYAKALSGFANSDGGLVIWGILARKNNQGINCAVQLKEIEQLSLFLSRLNELEGQYVNPRIDGVRHKKIEADSNRGIAITLVPPSDIGPHMAKAGIDRYYKRSGDSFYRMEHFDIEDMFGRRKKPILSLYTSIKANLQSSGPEGRMFEVHVIFGLKNEGRGLAKYIYLAVGVNLPYVVYEWGLDRTSNIGLRSLRSSTGSFVRFLGDSNLVIHSGSDIEISSIKRRIGEREQNIEDIRIDYEIRAEGMKEIKNRIIVKSEDIKEKIKELTS